MSFFSDGYEMGKTVKQLTIDRLRQEIEYKDATIASQQQEIERLKKLVADYNSSLSVMLDADLRVEDEDYAAARKAREEGYKLCKAYRAEQANQVPQEPQ